MKIKLKDYCRKHNINYTTGVYQASHGLIENCELIGKHYYVNEPEELIITLLINGVKIVEQKLNAELFKWQENIKKTRRNKLKEQIGSDVVA